MRVLRQTAFTEGCKACLLRVRQHSSLCKNIQQMQSLRQTDFRNSIPDLQGLQSYKISYNTVDRTVSIHRYSKKRCAYAKA